LKPVVNVGAGAGSYEPTDRAIVAVEPSREMIRQRPMDAAPVVQAAAEALPFSDNAFAAALAVLTVHHWSDRRRGLAELRRVSRDRIVLLTFDAELAPPFWLVDRYFPEIAKLDQLIMAPMAELRSLLGPIEVRPVPIPHDCTDGFMGAYWRRPATYLDPDVRHAISAFARISDVALGLRQLEADLQDGTWERLYGHILEETELDLGYRIVTVQLH